MCYIETYLFDAAGRLSQKPGGTREPQHYWSSPLYPFEFKNLQLKLPKKLLPAFDLLVLICTKIGLPAWLPLMMSSFHYSDQGKELPTKQKK